MQKLTRSDNISHKASGVAQCIQARPWIVGRRTVDVVSRDVIAHRRGRHLRLSRVVGGGVRAYVVVCWVAASTTLVI